MRFLLGAVLFVGTVFTAEKSEEFGVVKPTVMETDGGNTPEQLEKERLAKLAAERVAARVAAREARKARLKKGGKVGFSDGGDNQTVGKIVGAPAFVEEFAGENLSGDISAAQEKAVISAGEQRSFSVAAEEREHPLSTLESVEIELSRNQKAQEGMKEEIEKLKKIEKLSLEEEEYYKKLEDDLFRLQEQETLLVNSLEFLAFSKEKSSSVTFTGHELEEIFTFLDLNSVANDLSYGELRKLAKSTESAQKRIKNNVEQDGSVWFNVGTIVTDAPSVLGENYRVIGEEKQVKKSYFQNFSEAKKKILLEYLSTRERGIYRVMEGKAPDYSSKEEKVVSKKYFDERMQSINSMAKELVELLNDPLANKEEIETQIASIRVMIGTLHEKLNEKYLPPSLNRKVLSEYSIEGDVQESYSQLLAVANNAAILIDKHQIVEMMYSKEWPSLLTKENSPETVKVVFALAEMGSDFKDMFQPESNSEQGRFVKKIVQQAKKWADLKAQATEEMDTNNVLRMQELQGEISAFHDTVLEGHWSDPMSEKINSDFRKEVQNLVNAIDLKFDAKAQKFPKLMEQARKWAALKTQATEAIDSGNVIRMQELQDEMRDLYEDVFRNSSKDPVVDRINANFRKNMQTSINKILEEFKKKTATLPAKKRSLLGHIRYKVKRFFVRATLDPRKIRYISESTANKKGGWGLKLANFTTP